MHFTHVRGGGSAVVLFVRWEVECLVAKRIVSLAVSLSLKFGCAGKKSSFEDGRAMTHSLRWVVVVSWVGDG